MVSTTAKVGAGLAALLVLVVLFLPLFQAIFYGLFIASPATLYWLVIGGGLTALAYSTGHPTGAQVLLGATVVMALFIGPMVSGIYAHEYMADRIAENAETDTLPETSESQMRVLPRSVADKYASSSMQYPQHRLTQSDITEVNGTYQWSYGLQPDAFFVSWFGHQRGALYTSMETVDKDVTVRGQQEFKNGRGQIWFDSYQYQSVLANPLVRHNWGTTFNSEHNGTPYIAHSTTGHNWHFKLFPIPQPYAVPKHATTDVMYQNGTIDVMSPSQAQQSELLEGENIYPYHLAKFKVNSMKYRHGALNKWFWKEDVLQIADLPEGGNSWPLVVPTQEGNSTELTYFIATEPTGSGNGVYEVWTFDGQTGEATVQRYNSSQIGPQKAVDFVERQPEVNRLSSAQAVAPIPVTHEGTLYWHIKVVPKSNSGVVYTAFVNAESGDVTLLEGTQPIYTFLTEGEAEGIQQGQNATQGNTTGSTVTVTVLVTDDSGNIVRTENVTVPEGGSVSVEVENNNSTNSTAG